MQLFSNSECWFSRILSGTDCDFVCFQVTQITHLRATPVVRVSKINCPFKIRILFSCFSFAPHISWQYSGFWAIFILQGFLVLFFHFHLDFAAQPRVYQTYIQSTALHFKTYFVPLVLGLDVRLRRKSSGGYPGFECQHRVYCRHQRPLWGDGERGWGVGTTLEGTFGRATPGGDTNSNRSFIPLFQTHFSLPRLR